MFNLNPKNWFKKKAPVESIGCIAKTILFDLSNNEVTCGHGEYVSEMLCFSIKSKKYELFYFAHSSGNVYVKGALDFSFNKTEKRALGKMLDDILEADKQKRADDAYLKSLKKLRTFFPECL